VSALVNLNVNSDLEIYPNPVMDVLHLKTDLGVKRIIISDLLGKRLKSVVPENAIEISVPVSDLNSGTYLIRLEQENGIKTGRFIKR
jgi:hypothetical protein